LAFGVAVLAAVPANADAAYYLYCTTTIFNPYSSYKALVGGPFDSYADCSHMMSLEPHNYIPGGSEVYSCEIHY
jgi:hypothetical protein